MSTTWRSHEVLAALGVPVATLALAPEGVVEVTWANPAWKERVGSAVPPVPGLAAALLAGRPHEGVVEMDGDLVSARVDPMAELSGVMTLSPTNGDVTVQAALDAVVRVSGLLTDVDDDRSLRAVRTALVRSVARWVQFYSVADGVRPLEHLAGPSTRPTGRSIWRDVEDPVRDLLAASWNDSITLDVTADPEPLTATGDLLAVLRDPVTGVPPGTHEVHIFPLRGRRSTRGVMVMAPLGNDEVVLTVGRLVARRVAMAMENAFLYQREHEMAETLQRSMLPAQAEVDGLDVWTYYSPNAAHAQVGGDWYDVLKVAPDAVGIVVGDVEGHDVEAAAVMGQLRSVVRAYAHELRDPATVIERVAALVGSMGLERGAALVYASLTPDAEVPGRWRARYARAGHLPPLHVAGGAARALDEVGGPMIGFVTSGWTSSEVVLDPGDLLVFYTDGLIESRTRDLRSQIGELADLLATLPPLDAASVGEEILAATQTHANSDDVAVVVLRVPGGPGTPDEAPATRLDLTSGPGAAKRARAVVVEVCRAAGTGAREAELVVSELVSNAVMHGRGRISLTIRVTGAGLRLEVADGDPTPPRQVGGDLGGLGGYGLQVVDRLADWGWRPSGQGKVVWALLRPSHPGQEPPAAGS